MFLCLLPVGLSRTLFYHYLWMSELILFFLLAIQIGYCKMIVIARRRLILPFYCDQLPIKVNKAFVKRCRLSLVWISIIAPHWVSIFPLTPWISKVVSGVKFAIRVCIINFNSSWPLSPLVEAVMIPKGFPEKTVVATHHSMAFFNPDGMLNTYSGVLIMTPSASWISCVDL